MSFGNIGPSVIETEGGQLPRSVVVAENFTDAADLRVEELPDHDAEQDGGNDEQQDNGEADDSDFDELGVAAADL